MGMLIGDKESYNDEYFTETKKQEAIRLAWVEAIGRVAYKYNKVFISEDHGCMDYDLRFGDVINEIEIVSEDKASGWAKVRPKSLSGIEDNNGWTSILSEDDLPKEEGSYFTLTNYSKEIIERDYPIFSKSMTIEDENKWWLENITHYQKIVKPSKPIF